MNEIAIASDTKALLSGRGISSQAPLVDDFIKQFNILCAFEQISTATGGQIHFYPQIAYLPALMGNDGEPVYLYHLVEGIEEFLNYDAVLEEYPTLNYTQVIGSLKFLRKIAQQNMRQLDLDAAEEQFTLNDAFLNELRIAYQNRENVSDVFADPNE